MSETHMDKAAREKARELAERRKEAMKSWSLGGMAHDKELADACLPLLDAIDAAEADNARLQARMSELEAAVETATPLIGARNDAAHPAIKEANINEAWHVLNRVRRPAPPVGDR